MYITIWFVVGLAGLVVGRLIDLQDHKQFLSDETNKYRTAANLTQLVWDNKLEKRAGKMIKKCTIPKAMYSSFFKWRNWAVSQNNTISIEDFAGYVMETWYNYPERKMNYFGKMRTMGCAVNKCNFGKHQTESKILFCVYQVGEDRRRSNNNYRIAEATV